MYTFIRVLMFSVVASSLYLAGVGVDNVFFWVVQGMLVSMYISTNLEWLEKTEKE